MDSSKCAALISDTSSVSSSSIASGFSALFFSFSIS
jgi:hypothetical protein